jgi:hypothetical protein
MVLQHMYSFSSNEESFDSRESLLAMNNTDTLLTIPDSAQRLKQRVELEPSSTHNSSAKQKQISQPIAMEVEIEGMEVLLHTLANREYESRESRCCSSSYTSTLYDSSDDDESVLQIRGSKNRCQFRNRGYVGRQWDPENDLNIDSLRLSRKTFEDTRKGRAENGNDNLDPLSSDSFERCNEAYDTVVITKKDPTRLSLPSTTSTKAVVFPTSHSSTQIQYRYAAISASTCHVDPIKN